MTVLSFFPESLGEGGLIAIPCIISHLTQLFADAFIAAKWAQFTEEPKAADAASADGVCLTTAEAAAPSDTLTHSASSGARGGEEAAPLAANGGKPPV